MESESAMAIRDRLQAALGDAYVLDRELSTGGPARVYTATDRTLLRPVVVKTLAPELVSDGAGERFRREILVTAQLHHPHIVPVLAAGDADGFLHYTMPYVDGETLRDRLDRSPIVPVAEVIRVLRDVATALDYAHGRGVVHRDIKPANFVLEGRTGRALVADFGIARVLDAQPHLTLDGIALGTPLYMSPEQIDGGPVDGRSDIYSLALVGWEMLAGRAVWAGESLCTVLYNQKHVALPSLSRVRSGVPVALRRLLGAASAKQPERRPTAADFISALDRITAPRPMRTTALRRLVAAAVLLVVTGSASRSATVPPDAAAVTLPSALGPVAVAIPVLSVATLPLSTPISTPNVVVRETLLGRIVHVARRRQARRRAHNAAIPVAPALTPTAVAPAPIATRVTPAPPRGALVPTATRVAPAPPRGALLPTATRVAPAPPATRMALH
jgi:eukaryotic-like serine/threonine-protein kinase